MEIARGRSHLKEHGVSLRHQDERLLQKPHRHKIAETSCELGSLAGMPVQIASEPTRVIAGAAV